MSSWDTYIDLIIGYCKDSQGDEHCINAAICGLDGVVWTTNTHSRGISGISGPEVQKIADCYKKKDFGALQAGGIVLGGTKYTFLRQDEDVVIGRLKTTGISIIRTNTAMVIGITGDGKQPGVTNNGLAKIVDYLKGQNM